MFKKKTYSLLLVFTFISTLFSPTLIHAQAGDDTSSEVNVETEQSTSSENKETAQELDMPLGPLHIRQQPLISVPEEFPEKFTYDDGVEISYPEDGVKGIYVTGHSIAGEKMTDLTNFVNETDLNAMVLDVKDDYGNVVLDLETENETIQNVTTAPTKASNVMGHMEENQIYPIARIVVFKDTKLAEAHPELSFTEKNNDELWYNGNGDAFVNPYNKDVWEYNVEIAKEAAKLGFKEIQFDYVRFPEGFEIFSDDLNYSLGDYTEFDDDAIGQRVAAVTDFVEYAKQELTPYGVDVSVDIFGYTATIPEARGIGQNFSEISEHADVVSSMIYPSHWGNGYFGIPVPDLEPYRLVDEYMEVELGILNQLQDPPITRPWLQDFTASYLGAGNYQAYDVPEVEAQIKALNDHDVSEFLLWDASNNYTRGVDYTPSED